MKGQLKLLLTAFTIALTTGGRALALPSPLQGVSLQHAALPQIPQRMQVIQVVNTAGSVHVNTAANLQSILYSLVVPTEVVGIALGTLYIVKTLKEEGKTPTSIVRGLSIGILFVIMALAIPNVYNWLFLSSGCGSVLFK
jgi:hypothetical protein